MVPVAASVKTARRGDRSTQVKSRTPPASNTRTKHKGTGTATAVTQPSAQQADDDSSDSEASYQRVIDGLLRLRAIRDRDPALYHQILDKICHESPESSPTSSARQSPVMDAPAPQEPRSKPATVTPPRVEPATPTDQSAPNVAATQVPSATASAPPQEATALRKPPRGGSKISSPDGPPSSNDQSAKRPQKRPFLSEPRRVHLSRSTSRYLASKPENAGKDCSPEACYNAMTPDLTGFEDLCRKLENAGLVLERLEYAKILMTTLKMVAQRSDAADSPLSQQRISQEPVPAATAAQSTPATTAAQPTPAHPRTTSGPAPPTLPRNVPMLEASVDTLPVARSQAQQAVTLPPQSYPPAAATTAASVPPALSSMSMALSNPAMMPQIHQPPAHALSSQIPPYMPVPAQQYLPPRQPPDYQRFTALPFDDRFRASQQQRLYDAADQAARATALAAHASQMSAQALQQPLQQQPQPQQQPGISHAHPAVTLPYIPRSPLNQLPIQGGRGPFQSNAQYNPVSAPLQQYPPGSAYPLPPQLMYAAPATPQAIGKRKGAVPEPVADGQGLISANGKKARLDQAVAPTQRVAEPPKLEPGWTARVMLKTRSDLVGPIDREKALRKTTYDVNTLARDILIAAGRHPVERPLNEHLKPLQAMQCIDTNADLATLRWDIIDPSPAGSGKQTTTSEGDSQQSQHVAMVSAQARETHRPTSQGVRVVSLTDAQAGPTLGGQPLATTDSQSATVKQVQLQAADQTERTGPMSAPAVQSASVRGLETGPGEDAQPERPSGATPTESQATRAVKPRGETQSNRTPTTSTAQPGDGMVASATTTTTDPSAPSSSSESNGPQARPDKGKAPEQSLAAQLLARFLGDGGKSSPKA
ncbi:hypothetical protein KEM52_002751 [Ascosphaera acerosa]|nr:hypothetical protein KEM52_002751 [Ascosphaera acerosa]